MVESSVLSLLKARRQIMKDKGEIPNVSPETFKQSAKKFNESLDAHEDAVKKLKGKLKGVQLNDTLRYGNRALEWGNNGNLFDSLIRRSIDPNTGPILDQFYSQRTSIPVKRKKRDIKKIDIQKEYIDCLLRGGLDIPALPLLKKWESYSTISNEREHKIEYYDYFPPMQKNDHIRYLILYEYLESKLETKKPLTSTGVFLPGGHLEPRVNYIPSVRLPDDWRIDLKECVFSLSFQNVHPIEAYQRHLEAGIRPREGQYEPFDLPDGILKIGNPLSPRSGLWIYHDIWIYADIDKVREFGYTLETVRRPRISEAAIALAVAFNVDVFILYQKLQEPKVEEPQVFSSTLDYIPLQSTKTDEEWAELLKDPMGQAILDSFAGVLRDWQDDVNRRSVKEPEPYVDPLLGSSIFNDDDSTDGGNNFMEGFFGDD